MQIILNVLITLVFLLFFGSALLSTPEYKTESHRVGRVLIPKTFEEIATNQLQTHRVGKSIVFKIKN